MTAPSLPTLFGRFTALQSDQRTLFATFRQLHDWCCVTEPRRGTRTDEQPTPLFDELLTTLSQHFSAEEADGYFGAIVLERPSLLHEISALKAEHAAILTALTALAHAAAAGTASGKFASAIHHCGQWLQAHEQREAQILHEFLLSTNPSPK